MTSLRIETLTVKHGLEGFDCGVEELNRFLTRFAWQNQRADAAKTYVALADAEVIGFYSLAAGEIAYDAASERLRKGLAKHPIPTVLLARLAVAQRWQGGGRGIGPGLLKDAFKQTLEVANRIGVRALVVDAKDDRAVGFYGRFGFAPLTADSRRMIRLVTDLRRDVSAPSTQKRVER